MIPVVVALASTRLAQAGLIERAVELVRLSRHRTLDAEPQIESEPALAILRQALSADELEAAMARGRALSLDAVVVELMDEGATQPLIPRGSISSACCGPSSTRVYDSPRLGTTGIRPCDAQRGSLKTNISLMGSWEASWRSRWRVR